ncbi:hypothetical protein C6Y50_15980 [Stutzerimonas stutzeri]|nr:hypothetical protein C6Y50_15980 [Stutzerimonas stutzeri]
MRRRTRLNLFIEPEHASRLDELATKKGVSNASLVAAALARCLSSASTEQHQRDCIYPRVWPQLHIRSQASRRRRDGGRQGGLFGHKKAELPATTWRPNWAS